MTDDLSIARFKMVRDQISARGVCDPLVLEAMRQVPREKFIPSKLAKRAYADEPLPIGSNQTISQPFIVAYMVEALELKGNEKILEIGTGSGYAAAILSEIASEVFTIERIKPLAEQAQQRLRDLNYQNAHVLHADGTQGWPDEAPFDAIMVSAGGPQIPESLKSQLSVGGRMVIPVGPSLDEQRLANVHRVSASKFKVKYIANVRFVPLLGAEGHRCVP